jgi:hypothetical protein
VTYSFGVPRSSPAMIRPPVSVSSIAYSSATRIGLRIGTTGPSTAIFARFTTWVRAPANTMGLGVREKPA